MSGPRQPLFAPMAHAAAASPIAEVSGTDASGGAARGSLRMAAQHSTGARIKASTRRRPPAALAEARLWLEHFWALPAAVPRNER